MLLDIIILNKSNEEISHDKIIENFKGKLVFKTNKIFCGQLSFNYKFQESINKNNIRLKISTSKGTGTKSEAKEIDFLKNKIRNGAHRKDYRIIVDYDGASEYYCSKLSRYISIFERKLRQFIYIITLVAYGNKWIEETFSEDIQKDVTEKENNKNRHIEMALECFTFQNFIDYLFKKRNEIDVEEVIKTAIDVTQNSESDKEDILRILNKAKKVSLWDKLFEGYEMEFLEIEIDKIRKIRNDVMHNKVISDGEFDTYKTLLRKCNKKIENAISKIENEKYHDTVNIADVFYSLNETMQSMVSLSKSIRELLTPAINDLNRISSIINKSVNMDGIVKSANLALKNNIAEISLLNNQKLINSIEALQRSIISESCIEKINISTNLMSSIPNLNIQMEQISKSIAPIKHVYSNIPTFRNLDVYNKMLNNITNIPSAAIINNTMLMDIRISNMVKSVDKENKICQEISKKLKIQEKSTNLNEKADNDININTEGEDGE